MERVANKFLETLEMSDHERLEVMLICKTFHTSATDLSKRYVKPNMPSHQSLHEFGTTHIYSIYDISRFLSELGRHNYVTPTSYLELIAAFRLLLTHKRDTVMKAKKRYTNGLEKLAFAESQVFLLCFLTFFKL